MANAAGESLYLHGTDRDEQARLSRLNELINERSLREMGLRSGERVLDVGSGLGQLTRAIARVVGAGLVVGVERSAEQLAEARRLAAAAGEAAVDFRQGDAARPPLGEKEWGTFDVAHARFVIEHVPDPLAVVRGMARALRPGGRLILEDDGHDIMRLWPEPAGFDRIWRAYMRTYDRAGNDPLVGHRLVALLHEAGVAPLRNTWLFFGACAGQADLRAYTENLARILEGVRERILELGDMDAAGFEAILKSLREWASRPDAALWYATSWAEGRRQ
ncbi:MAG TPA: methyltransferase domain-containing protein [Gemmataceae bacterium]|jgi:SAM-dependent methyltransferase|nr:methyltransferase domain-containing protein [Gemmataceae bacterium]